MSTPNEHPRPEQPGMQPPPPGYQGGPAQPPPGYQPPGYQQPIPPQQGAQQPGSFKFEMPADMPRSVNDVMPAGGFSGIFKTDGLPSLLKVSYIIWLVTAGLGILINALILLGSMISLGLGVGSAARGFVSSLISITLMAAVVLFAMKLKEGLQWARLALSAVVVLSIALTWLGASGTGLLGLVAAVLMWLPESTAWLNFRAGNNRQ